MGIREAHAAVAGASMLHTEATLISQDFIYVRVAWVRVVVPRQQEQRKSAARARRRRGWRVQEARMVLIKGMEARKQLALLLLCQLRLRTIAV